MHKTLRLLTVLSAVGGGVLVGRRWQLRWGATPDEVAEELAGDELLARADLMSTRAITIDAPADCVWPWIAQLGQGRGGFYSYDALENMVGCDIHSAQGIQPEWQVIAVGDEVRLAPQVALKVAKVEPGTELVLRGGVPMGNTAPPYDFTWAFVLRSKGRGTRLLVRERYRYLRRWSGLLVEPVEALSFLMTQRMLRGIRDRSLRGTGAASPERTPAT